MTGSSRAGGWSAAEAIPYAPPPFVVQGKRAIPVEIVRYELALDLDVAARRATAVATLDIVPAQQGFAFVDFVQAAASVTVDGVPTRLLEVTPPPNEAKLRLVDRELRAGNRSTLEIRYELQSANVVFDADGVRLGFFMSDLSPRGYLERYGPANLEFDAFRCEMQVRVSGGVKPHRVYTNASEVSGGHPTWSLAFPDYFTCSSYYLHITHVPFVEQRAVFAGAERQVPILIYGESTELVVEAKTRALKVLAELEGTYGPYAHQQLVVYVVPQMSGAAGMEYAGATMTTLRALGHEITHSWFARGVMPADGNAGWIDEAIASWRDAGYPRIPPSGRRPVNLAAFSPYRRYTTSLAYSEGKTFLGELDHRFARRGGLRPILRELFLAKRRDVITTPLFQQFLEAQTGEDLDSAFNRYVYGREDDERVIAEDQERAAIAPTEAVFPKVVDEEPLEAPPRPFTQEELRQLL